MIRGMKIRKYRDEDCASTISLFRRTVRTVNRRDYDEEQVNAWAPDRIDPNSWNGSLQSNYAVVAEDEEGCLLGFGDMDDCGYLDRLFVSADHQREGVGTRILEELEEYAVQIGVIKITTQASISAVPFFESKGYRTERENRKLHNGVWFVNYWMAKEL